MTLCKCYGQIVGAVLWRSLLYGVPFAMVWPLPVILCAAITIHRFIALPR